MQVALNYAAVISFYGRTDSTVILALLPNQSNPADSHNNRNPPTFEYDGLIRDV